MVQITSSAVHPETSRDQDKLTAFLIATELKQKPGIGRRVDCQEHRGSVVLSGIVRSRGLQEAAVRVAKNFAQGLPVINRIKLASH